jgi:hypothetical protein
VVPTPPVACLFCGEPLSDSNRTAEDVFPKWLQQRYGVASHELELANHTTLRYSQLLVPACATCNNVHASQLEGRVSRGTASLQEMWLWMLKIQLGIYYWESGKPLSRDRRSPDHGEPISSLDLINLSYFHTLFSGLKRGATFDPSPSGTILHFPNAASGFDYADRLFCHPRAPDRLYSAGMIAFDGTTWIAFFDDGGRTPALLDMATVSRLFAEGHDPHSLLPELLYSRSRLDWMPTVLIATGADGQTEQVITLPSMGAPTVFDFDADDLASFYPSPD